MPGTNGQALQDGGWLTDMLPIDHLHISDGERARYPWRLCQQGPVHTETSYSYTCCYMSSRQPQSHPCRWTHSWELGVSGCEGLEIKTENCCVPPPFTQVVFQASGLCGNLRGLYLSPDDGWLGKAQSFEEEGTVQAGSQIDYTKPHLDRCANICLMMSQSSPLPSGWGPEVMADRVRRTAQSYYLSGAVAEGQKTFSSFCLVLKGLSCARLGPFFTEQNPPSCIWMKISESKLWTWNSGNMFLGNCEWPP